MTNFLIGFLAIVAVKSIINLTKYFQCKRLLKLYEKWLKDTNWEYYQRRSIVLRLWESAGVQDANVPSVERVEGYEAVEMLSVFKNFPNRDLDFPQHTFRIFHESIGVYRSRMFESFSPIYWLELLVHLPKKSLIYLSVKPESVLIRIMQVVWWLIITMSTFIFGIYKPFLEEIVKGWKK